MEPDTTLTWVALLALGAVHGVNPAMGWLFAVSLGLQEQRRKVVWQALAPLALGHALSIVAVVALAAAVGLVIPLDLLRWIVAGVLLVFGIAHLTRHRHPRGGGMKVGARDLTVWSFLVSSAHGAGLMALPFVMELQAAGSGAHAGTGGGLNGAAGADGAAGAAVLAEAAHHGQATGLSPGWEAALAGSAVHTASYLLVTGIVAVVVYEWLGLRLLRSAWINLNLVWALALIATAILTPLW